MSFLLFLSFVYIGFIVIKRGYLVIEDAQGVFWKFVILLSGFFSIFVGIDRGESIYGFWRLCVYLIVGMAIQQMSEKDRRLILSSIPILGIFFSVCSLFHKCIVFKYWIVQQTGRLAGPFEYPNTMALFLLVGVIIVEHCWKHVKYIIQLPLIISVIATGSRTVFTMLCVYLLYRFIKCRGKNKVLIMFMAVVCLIIYISVVCDWNLYGFSRFMQTDINSSTLQGRLLYWEDALRMLVKHPLGLGYMGYFYLQQAEQTGVYSVRFVHNEWLQWLLDYGILAGVGGVMYLIRQFKRKKMRVVEKELLCVIAVCSFFDFHLQFASILCIVILLLPGGNITFSIGKLRIWRCAAVVGMVVAIGLCFADIMAQSLASQGDYEHAVLWNPLSAQYKQEYLLQSEDLTSAAVYADKLLRGNRYLYVAYLIKSNAAASEGRVDIFIENRKQFLKLRKYNIDEYEDYFQILLSWYSKAYVENNDEVMNQCKEAMKEIPEIIMEVKKQTSVRAFRIHQKPELNFNKEYEKIIEAL